MKALFGLALACAAGAFVVPPQRVPRLGPRPKLASSPSAADFFSGWDAAGMGGVPEVPETAAAEMAEAATAYARTRTAAATGAVMLATLRVGAFDPLSTQRFDPDRAARLLVGVAERLRGSLPEGRGTLVLVRDDDLRAALLGAANATACAAAGVRFGSLLGSGGAGLSADGVGAAVASGAADLGAADGAVLIVSPGSPQEMVGVRAAVRGATRSGANVLVLNHAFKTAPVEFDDAECVYEVTPLVVSAKTRNPTGATSDDYVPAYVPKVVVVRRFPEPWQLFVDADGGGYVSALSSGRPLEGPALAQEVARFVQRRQERAEAREKASAGLAEAAEAAEAAWVAWVVWAAWAVAWAVAWMRRQ